MAAVEAVRLRQQALTAARAAGDIDAAVRAAAELVGAERVVALAEADATTWSRSQP